MLTISFGAVLLGLLSVAPQASASPLHGTWEGSIGSLPIRACFDQNWGSFGGYYYRSQLRYIHLEGNEQDSSLFVEGTRTDKIAARWSVKLPDAVTMEGSWSQSGRSLPIHLRRASWPRADESACGSLAFHQPRLVGVHDVTSGFVKDGIRFRRVSVDLLGRFEESSQSTVQLDGDTPAIRKINAALFESFSSPTPAWLDCILSPLEDGQSEGDYEESYEPRLITPRWLSVSHSVGYYCGGAHPDGGENTILFNRRTGEKVDLLDWFGPAAVRREGTGSDLIKTLTRSFAAVVSSNAKGADGECRDVILDAEFWDLELTAKAIRFTPSLPHVVQGCADTYTVPHERLMHYLNAASRAEIARL